MRPSSCQNRCPSLSPRLQLQSEQYFKVCFIDYAITVVQFFSPLYPHSALQHPSLQHPPPQFMSMGRTQKFFGFYISYTILNLPPSIFYLPFMLLIPCTFSSIHPSHSPMITLHVISISVILFLSQLFAFNKLLFQQFVFIFLGSVLNSCLLSFYCSYF